MKVDQSDSWKFSIKIRITLTAISGTIPNFDSEATVHVRRTTHQHIYAVHW